MNYLGGSARKNPIANLSGGNSSSTSTSAGGTSGSGPTEKCKRESSD